MALLRNTLGRMGFNNVCQADHLTLPQWIWIGPISWLIRSFSQVENLFLI